MFAKFQIKNISSTIKEKVQEKANSFVKKKSANGCSSCGSKGKSN